MKKKRCCFFVFVFFAGFNFQIKKLFICINFFLPFLQKTENPQACCKRKSLRQVLMVAAVDGGSAHWLFLRWRRVQIRRKPINLTHAPLFCSNKSLPLSRGSHGNIQITKAARAPLVGTVTLSQISFERVNVFIRCSAIICVCFSYIWAVHLLTLRVNQ